MVFTSLADAIINPGHEPLKGEFYPENVAKNMDKFALMMSIVMGVCGILSQVLMFPMDNVISTDKDTTKNSPKKKEPNEIERGETQEKFVPTDKEEDERNYDPDYLTEQEEIEKSNKEAMNQPFMQAFKSIRFHLFNFMSVGTLCK